MMLALGDYFFSGDTASYQNKAESRNYRWEPQNVIGQCPLYHYMGPGEQDLKLDGVVYSDYHDGLSQLPLMKQAAAKGEPLMLVDGLGNVLGRWVITRLEEKQTTFCANGLPRKVEFSLDLKKVEDHYYTV
ncbi:tail assembly protein [Alphaproteobacteria bacterium]|nr:tail assembly protein [Alphaproteobacteria bacterium]